MEVTGFANAPVVSRLKSVLVIKMLWFWHRYQEEQEFTKGAVDLRVLVVQHPVWLQMGGDLLRASLRAWLPLPPLPPCARSLVTGCHLEGSASILSP